MPTQLKPFDPFDAAVIFITLQALDQVRGTSNAMQFARGYENDAPEGDFGVYLELLEKGRVAAPEPVPSN